MTNPEAAQRFVCVWNGGPLLPGYETQMSPAYQQRRGTVSTDRAVRRVTRPGTKRRKYGAAVRQAIRALRQHGLTLCAIAEHFHMPVRSVHDILHARED